MGIVQGTWKAMTRSMGAVKLVEKSSSKDPMQMLDLNETIDRLAKANVDPLVEKGYEQFSEKGIRFQRKGDKQKGRPKKTWLRAVVEQSRTKVMQ